MDTHIDAQQESILFVLVISGQFDEWKSEETPNRSTKVCTETVRFHVVKDRWIGFGGALLELCLGLHVGVSTFMSISMLRGCISSKSKLHDTENILTTMEIHHSLF